MMVNSLFCKHFRLFGLFSCSKHLVVPAVLPACDVASPNEQKAAAKSLED
jgi:hypothetical protein